MEKYKKQRELLETEHKRLANELQQTQDNASSAEERREGSPFGKKDETAAERFELDKRLALVQHIREQLTDVEYALEKLDKGTYGLCDSCGKPIPLARLEALPQANFCLDCKVHQAKNGKTRR